MLQNMREIKFDRATHPHTCARTSFRVFWGRGEIRAAWGLVGLGLRARGARGVVPGRRHAAAGTPEIARAEMRPSRPRGCVARGARIYSIDTLTHKRCLCQRIPASVEVVGRSSHTATPPLGGGPSRRAQHCTRARRGSRLRGTWEWGRRPRRRTQRGRTCTPATFIWLLWNRA